MAPELSWRKAHIVALCFFILSGLGPRRVSAFNTFYPTRLRVSTRQEGNDRSILPRRHISGRYSLDIGRKNAIQLSAKSNTDETISTGDKNENENNLPWLVSLCLPLWLVYVSNQWSRSSIYYLVDFSEAADPFKAMNLDIGESWKE